MRLLTMFLLTATFNASALEIPDSLKNPLLAPFYYGVMSGDPLHDRVIIWTHVTTDGGGPSTVEWQMATDTLFEDVVQSGTAGISPQSGTVRVDVTGLQPDSWYYYRFLHGSVPSIIGRTRTMPLGDAQQLRFGVMTCADFKDGYFNAYDRLVARNDIDAVIHLGDYIYESKGDQNNVRIPLPDRRCETVEDFRTRYAFYHLDPQLSAAHQQYPWFCIWDDHEFRNDAWLHGAVGLSGQEWEDLKEAALQAYHEWMPLRFPDPEEPLRIYRTLPLGNLADLIMLDARIIGREEPLDLDDPATQDPDRTVLGAVQREWLLNELASSTAQWRIVAQQILMTPYYLLGSPFQSTEKVWNGFPAERQRIFDFLAENEVGNVVVCTGDVHASFASDLPRYRTQYNSSTGEGSVAVEFVTPSVTSGGDIDLPQFIISLNNPYSVFTQLTERGYLIVDVTADTVFGNFYFTPYLQYSETETFGGCFYTESGTSHLRQRSGQSPRLGGSAPLAPAPPRMPTGLRPQIPLTNALRCYPNPTSGLLFIEVMVPGAIGTGTEAVLHDAKGARAASVTLHGGLNRCSISTEGMPSGVYVLHLQTPDFHWAQRVVVD